MSVTMLQVKTVGVHRVKAAVGRKSVRFVRKRKSIKPTSRVKQPSSGMSKKVTVKRTISQTSLANVTQANASQSSRCEEQLDEAIYKCLHSLTKRHEPTKEFKALFSRGAFLKPNTKAFIQVMHFLLNIYDAREFQKRFYWPIFDKAAENAFRTSTVEYVNSLIERGKLVGIAKIKAHVVVLPGGVKFMKFLLCVIRLVLQEECRRAKASSTGFADGEVLTKTSVAQMIDCHKRWVQAGGQLHAIVKEEVTLLAKNTEKIETLIETILAGSELAKKMSFDKLMQLWGVVIDAQFKEREKVQERSLAIAMEFQKIIEKAEAKMKSNELSMPFDREQLQDALNKAARHNLNLVPISQEVFDENGKLHPVKLVQVLELALPSVEQFFRNFCFKSQDVMKYEQTELSKVVVKVDGVRQQMEVLQRSLPILDDFLQREVHAHDEESPEVAKCENFAIKNKLFSTPPIVMDFEGRPDDAFAAGISAAGKACQRLALLNKEDVQMLNARMKLLSTSMCQPRSPKVPPRTQGKMPSDQSSPNAFAVPRTARKEKLNPLTMLNRIKALSQKHVTAVGGLRGALSAPVNSTMNISTLSDITLRPEFSSTLLGTPEKPAIPMASDATKAPEREKGSANLLQVPSQGSHVAQMHRLAKSPNVHSSPRLMAIYVGSTETPKSRRSTNSLLLAAGAARRSTSATKRNSLVDNVSVHTSPSGRLESVVKQNELMLPCEVLLVLEKKEEEAEEETGTASTNSGQGADTSDERTLIPEHGGQLADLSNTLIATSLDNKVTLVPAYHQQTEEVNSSQAAEKTLEKGLQIQHHTHADNEEPEEEDNLFNVSDGIVTDFE